MTPDLWKVLAVKTAGSRSASAASSLRMEADLEAKSCLMGLWRENRSGQLRTPWRRLRVHIFQALKVQTELVGALMEGHMLAVTIEVILVADYWHTKCAMVGCSDNSHLVKLGEDCAGYAQCPKHTQHGKELGA